MINFVFKLLKKVNRYFGLKYHLDLKRKYIYEFGFFQSFIIHLKIWNKNSNKGPCSIFVPSINNHVLIRPGTSDASTFEKIFLWKQYKIDLNEESDFIVDAGANIGLSSIWFANLFPEATIVAIEPDQNNYKLLLANCKSYPNINPVKAAIWGESCKLILSNPGARFDSYQYIEMEEEANLSVQAYDIKTILKMFDKKKIDILKIDIEGAEENMFSNNYEEWIECVSVIIIELHGLKAFNIFKMATMNIPSKQYEVGENLVFVRT